MRRWFRFSRLEYLSLRLTALILLWFALYKVIAAEFPRGEPHTPSLPQIEEQHYPEPAEHEPFRLL